MMDEDYGAPKSSNATPAIALGIAALLLLIVAAMTYRDAVREKYAQEYAEKERVLLERHGYPVAPFASAQQQQVAAQFAPQQPVPGGAPAQPVAQAAPAPMATPGGAPAQDSPDLMRNAAELGVEAGLPQPEDPEIASIRNSLDQVKEQGARVDQLYRDITSDVDSRAREEASRAGIGDLSTDLPEFLRVATENPPGGNPEVEERLSRERDRIRQSPSLATVTSYNTDFGFVTFNAGAAQNVAVDQRFAVRRGNDQVVGWVRVDEVYESESIASLVTSNKFSDTALKPEPGDTLIEFEIVFEDDL